MCDASSDEFHTKPLLQMKAACSMNNVLNCQNPTCIRGGWDGKGRG